MPLCEIMSQKIDLRNLTADEVENFVVELGLPAARGKQLFGWLYRPGHKDLAGPGGIGREVRARLAGHAEVSSLEPEKVEISRDGTMKFLFRLADGVGIESVLIPAEGRYTLCLSSQAGCAMGCRFCLTGAMGFTRNLRPAEMVNQLLAVMEYMIRAGIVRETPRQLVNNLVFMGMGEPLANYGNLLTALTILMDERGLGFSERRVTVSTCGLVPRMRDLGRDIRVNLAVSLHAPDDATRSGLMPVNDSYPVAALLDACRDYPLSRHRVILFEYILFQGINDSAETALLLAERLQGIPCRINLLPYNESACLPYRRPAMETIEAFRAELHRAGVRALIRNSRGADIAAACGQLAGGNATKGQENDLPRRTQRAQR